MFEIPLTVHDSVNGGTALGNDIRGQPVKF